MGTIRLSSTSPWQQERRIVGMIKSPVEGSTTVLLKLDRPVNTFSDFVRPVCLPSNQDPPANASHCNTLGWARNRKYSPFVPYHFLSNAMLLRSSRLRYTPCHALYKDVIMRAVRAHVTPLRVSSTLQGF